MKYENRTIQFFVQVILDDGDFTDASNALATCVSNSFTNIFTCYLLPCFVTYTPAWGEENSSVPLNCIHSYHWSILASGARTYYEG